MGDRDSNKMTRSIGIITTGGDCSGLNSVMARLVLSGKKRGYKMFGVLDGTDGLSTEKPNVIEFSFDTLPMSHARLAGSILQNGQPGALNFQTAAKNGQGDQFQSRVKRAIEELALDAVILLGGNGSISLAHANPAVYASTQLICIPKTIDMDIPLTDSTIGFETAVAELVKYADQLMLTAKSHHRWFVVQTMGRDSGFLCLHAGVAAGASAVLIPEVKWKLPDLINHIKNEPSDYGLIFVAEGCQIRGRSGEVAEIITRDMAKAGFSARTGFPEHLQRAGDTTAADRILAAQYATAALNAIENKETFVMTARSGGVVKTVSLTDIMNAGVTIKDPNIPGAMVSNEYVPQDHSLIQVARDSGIFIS